jgi:hypothetical protein
MGELPVKGVDPAIVQKTCEALTALGSCRGPIIVGPWLSEVGFELLYWIPFLRWACAFAKLHPDDLWVVSRGGCRSWYADIGAHYVDAFEFYSPAMFRAGNAQRVAEQASHADVIGLRPGQLSSKQHAVTSFDREILAHVTRQTGLEDVRLLHPSMMYRLFRPFWRRQLPSLYTQMTRPRRLSVRARVDGLPTSYVAAKFYASAACHNSPVHSRMVNACVRAVAETTDVVLLHSGERYDDHGEFTIDRHPRVHRVPMDPATNLETQTAVIAGARSFIGTYGGFAYLAPFLGVPARTFYAQPNFRRDHRQVIDHVCAGALRTSFAVELVGGGSQPRARRRAVRRAA